MSSGDDDRSKCEYGRCSSLKCPISDCIACTGWYNRVDNRLSKSRGLIRGEQQLLLIKRMQCSIVRETGTTDECIEDSAKSEVHGGTGVRW